MKQPEIDGFGLAEIVSRFRADVSRRNDSWFTVGRRPEYYYLDIFHVGNSLTVLSRMLYHGRKRPGDGKLQ